MDNPNLDYTHLPDNYLDLQLDDILLAASDFFEYDNDEIEENPLLDEKKKEFNCNLSLL